MILIVLVQYIYCAVKLHLYSETNNITKQTTLIIGLEDTFSMYFGAEVHLNNKMLKNELRIFKKVPDHLNIRYKHLISSYMEFFIETVDTSLLKSGKIINLNLILDIEVFRRRIYANILDFYPGSIVYQTSFDLFCPVLVKKIIKIGKDDYNRCLDILEKSNIRNEDQIKYQLSQISDTYLALENKYREIVFHMENYNDTKTYYCDNQVIKRTYEESVEIDLQEEDIYFQKSHRKRSDKKYNFIKDILKVNEIIKSIRNSIQDQKLKYGTERESFDLFKEFKDDLSIILSDVDIKEEIPEHELSIVETTYPYIILLSSMLYYAFFN